MRPSLRVCPTPHKRIMLDYMSDWRAAAPPHQRPADVDATAHMHTTRAAGTARVCPTRNYARLRERLEHGRSFHLSVQQATAARTCRTLAPWAKLHALYDEVVWLRVRRAFCP